MKRIALLVAFAVLLSSQAQAGTWLKSLTAAQKKAKESNSLIFVDMFAQWCGWCHRFEAEVFPSQAFQNATDDLVLLRLDTEDGNEGTKLSQKFGITSLPTFLLLTPDLTIAGIIRGYAPPAEFATMLGQTRGKYTDFQMRVKNEASIAGDYQKRLDLAREFMSRGDYAASEPRLKKLLDEKKAAAAVRDQAHYELAVGYVLQKKYPDAMTTINKLTARSKSGEPVERARLLVAQIYMDQGNLAAAATEFRKFKQSFPNSPLVKNVDQVLPEIEKRIAAGAR
ncbi:MAG TPA: thioredoxin fold domain-containing protein [Thermoanaerobaculia bacterium]|nr:thioredoxin fold domain-containing protein [Thermoanaerobaculia bacterium]